jgi:hypothetical protein
MDLVGLTYVSIRRHTPDVDPLQELRRIHRCSVDNNPALGITGVLLCTKNHYIQFIEGEEKVVRDLFEFYRGFTKDVTITAKILVGALILWAVAFPEQAGTFLAR